MLAIAELQILLVARENKVNLIHLDMTPKVMLYLPVVEQQKDIEIKRFLKKGVDRIRFP